MKASPIGLIEPSPAITISPGSCGTTKTSGFTEAATEEYLATQQKKVNGWGMSNLFGDRAFFAGNWLKRAAGARAGIYGNEASEAKYMREAKTILTPEQYAKFEAECKHGEKEKTTS